MTKISIGVPTRGVRRKGNMKTKEKVLSQYYLNMNDIKTLLGVSHKTAKKIYEKADEIDENKFKEYRVEERKVTMKSVLEVNHLTMKDLERRL